MNKKLYSANEKLGSFLENVISGMESIKEKSPIKKCIICNRWVKFSSINEKYICCNCVEINENISRKQSFRKMISKPKILFIYDTSYLMKPYGNKLYFKNDYSIEKIILDGVKNEILNHINNNDDQIKSSDGKHARRLVSEIMSKNGYIEYNEKDIPVLNISEKILGPDSKVDKRILSLANANADVLTEDLKTNSTFSYIFTHDGGIKTEAITLFNKHKKLVFTSSSIAIFNDLLEKIESLINEKSNSLAMSN